MLHWEGTLGTVQGNLSSFKLSEPSQDAVVPSDVSPVCWTSVRKPSADMFARSPSDRHVIA